MKQKSPRSKITPLLIREDLRALAQEITHIFLDVDGTLLGQAHLIDQEVVDTLQSLSEKGMTISLATGRPLFSSYDLFERLPFLSLSMFCSGSLLYDPNTGKTVWTESILPSQVSHLLQMGAAHDWYVELYTPTEYFIEQLGPLTVIHQFYLKKPPTVAKLQALTSRQDVIKGVVMFPRVLFPSEMQDLQQRLPGLALGFAYGGAHPNITFMNVTSALADRKNAFHEFLTRLHLSPNQTLAIGDGPSDIPFLQMSSIGVAMGNASPEVKAAANLITEGVENAGVASALRALFLPNAYTLRV